MPYYDHDKDYPFAAFITNRVGEVSHHRRGIERSV